MGLFSSKIITMKEYLFLFRGGDDSQSERSPEQLQAHMKRWMEWMGALQERHLLLAAQPLSKSGRQIAGSSKIVTDGPFAAGKEVVGGYLVCRANDYTDAAEIAKNCPILEFASGKVEVREVQEMKMQ
jgi:hypothetical protein